jgi:SAM-dependent methyltransferase
METEHPDRDWETCYQVGDTHWDKGEPSPGLVDWLAAHPSLPRGSVAVPGCGFGHDVREWARAGFTATGFDIAPSAVTGSRERTNGTGLAARFHQCDFLSTAPPEPFDWVFEHTFFCALDPGRRPDHVNSVLRHLNPGGQLLAVHYFLPKEEDGPPFGTDRDEIIERFSPYFDLVEDWVPRSYPNRTGLERMFWWRRKA